MSHIVIKAFTDLLDDNYRYNVGDKYPRKGAKTTDKRINELSSTNNRRRTPLIIEVVPAAVVSQDDAEEVQEKKPKETKPRRSRKKN